MEKLVEKMKEALADTYVFELKAQSYHWNVIGQDFEQLHALFGGIYEDAQDAVDGLAEQIRQLNAFAPGSLNRMKELSSIEENDLIPTASKMVTNLITANEAVMKTITEAYEIAEGMKVYALSNYLQDRLTAHAKHNWMLKATAGQKA